MATINIGFPKAAVAAATAFLAACSPNALYHESMNASAHSSYQGRKVLEQTEWYRRNYTAYEPDAATVAELARHLDGVRVLVFSGSAWCSDTRLYLPRYYKVMDMANAPDHMTVMLEVDEAKRDAYDLAPRHNVQAVPTFLVYKNGQLRGRVIEKPADSFEQDLLGLVR